MGDIVPTSIGGVKATFWLALKILIALTLLNFATKQLLGISVGQFLDDPIGTLKGLFTTAGKRASEVIG